MRLKGISNKKRGGFLFYFLSFYFFLFNFFLFGLFLKM
ncbi:putative membrane protein [Helicobacter pylori CPY1962]|nr:putative membrane protein [Helicobacter pylori CPY1962]